MTETVTLFLALLTWVAIVAVATTAMVWIVAPWSDWATSAKAALQSLLGSSTVAIALAVAVIATLGSLYLSEGAGFPPCTLCWYQRIAMYPLVPILIVALARREPSGRWYAVPLAAVGALISAYHYAVQQFPALDSGTCSVDAPCTVVWVSRFGFMTIPFMALLAFLLILAALLAWYTTPQE